MFGLLLLLGGSRKHKERIVLRFGSQALVISTRLSATQPQTNGSGKAPRDSVARVAKLHGLTLMSCACGWAEERQLALLRLDGFSGGKPGVRPPHGRFPRLCVGAPARGCLVCAGQACKEDDEGDVVDELEEMGQGDRRV